MSLVSKTDYDFSGFATRVGIRCTDGRTIMKDAFKHQDGAIVPLVWQHCHNDPSNVLGHVLLENRNSGVYCYGKFNDTESAKHAKELIRHKDITSLSIYANQLKEAKGKVFHGCIREVSLVLAGANPGAVIDNISFAHSDGSGIEYIDETEAIIYSGEEGLFHGEVSEMREDKNYEEIFNTLNDEQKDMVYQMLVHAATSGKNDDVKEKKDEDDRTVQEIFDTLTEEQKKVVYYLIGAALEEQASEFAKHDDVGGDEFMKTNVFDQSTRDEKRNVLSHSQMENILKDGKKYGSLRDSFFAHTEAYGFDPVNILFPDAKDVTDGLQTIRRRTEWVEDVLKNTNHTPFSRIKTRIANLTVAEARAKGYIKGNLKTESVIPLMKRVTTPTTIYKKEKLDRDDIVDIADFDVVVWLKREMRSLLDEEIARAILIGDGRQVGDPDKISEECVRPIAMDDGNLFVERIQINPNATVEQFIDEVVRSRKYYKGSGNPSMYTTTDLLTEMLLVKDGMNHRMYKTTEELASVLRVKNIVEVEPMNTAVRKVGDDEYEIMAIIVNLKDYTVGADKGGEVNLFDDFDIDYNQEKYLIETRISGALTVPKSAIVFERKKLNTTGNEGSTGGGGQTGG